MSFRLWHGKLHGTWCIGSEALRKATHVKGAHGYGGNWGGHKASYHHNLNAHCEIRVPRLGPRPSTLALGECVDIRNNVFYNWAGNGCYGGEEQHVNIVNNYYKPGPATKQASKQVQYRIAKVGVYPQAYVYVDGEPKKNLAFQPYLQKWGTFYIDGNKIEGNSKVTVDNWTEETEEAIRLKEPLDFGVITTYPTDTGDLPWPELAIAGLSAPVDSDGDGMPDEREMKNGLDANDPTDGNAKTLDPNGQYTNLEMYLNSLVQEMIDSQNK